MELYRNISYILKLIDAGKLDEFRMKFERTGIYNGISYRDTFNNIHISKDLLDQIESHPQYYKDMINYERQL